MGLEDIYRHSFDTEGIAGRTTVTAGASPESPPQTGEEPPPPLPEGGGQGVESPGGQGEEEPLLDGELNAQGLGFQSEAEMAKAYRELRRAYTQASQKASKAEELENELNYINLALRTQGYQGYQGYTPSHQEGQVIPGAGTRGITTVGMPAPEPAQPPAPSDDDLAEMTGIPPEGVRALRQVITNALFSDPSFRSMKEASMQSRISAALNEGRGNTEEMPNFKELEPEMAKVLLEMPDPVSFVNNNRLEDVRDYLYLKAAKRVSKQIRSQKAKEVEAAARATEERNRAARLTGAGAGGGSGILNPPPGNAGGGGRGRGLDEQVERLMTTGRRSLNTLFSK